MTKLSEEEERLIQKMDEAGDLITGDDGYLVFWPKESRGAFNAFSLRVIADTLDRRNKVWDEQVRRDLSR
jgi:hypothetical protein